MHQFSRNYGLILKTFLYQVVMSLFGFMMYSSIYRIPFLMIMGQFTITLFFLFIMGYQMFQKGAKNCEYDRAHDLTSSPFLGFLFALIAFLPSICLSLGTVIVPPYTANGVMTGGYAPFLINKFFMQGMYVGFVQMLFPTSANDAVEALAKAGNSQCLIHLISAIPGILACGIGYFIGHRQFSKEKKK